MNRYERYEPFGGDINVKVALSNYVTETDFKNVTHVDTSSFALKTNLANLNAETDKLDIDKLAPIPVDLTKISDVVKNDIKETVYDKLNANVNSIDTSGFVLKTQYDTDKCGIENKIPNTSDFVKQIDYNTKITEIEGKLTDHDHDKHITTLEFNNLAAAVFDVRLKWTILVTKTDFDAKLSSLNRKNTENKAKHLLE